MTITFKAELRRQEDEAKKLRLQGQNPDGGPEGDFMSEAKDWAGELISGQTGTGRILVSFNLNPIFVFTIDITNKSRLINIVNEK